MVTWEEIGAYLEDKGHDRKNLKTLLAFIEATETPLELSRILQNLLQLLPYIADLIILYPEHGCEIHLAEWKSTCQEIQTYPKLTIVAAPTRRKQKMPLWGFYGSNQVYVAIWERPGSPLVQRTYFFLLAHCLLAIAFLRNRMEKEKRQEKSGGEINNFNGNIKDVLLTIRNLAQDKNLHILESLPDHKVNPEELLEILNGGDEMLAPLRVLFKYLFDFKRPPHRHEREHPHDTTTREKIDPRIDQPAEFIEISPNLDPDQKEGTNTIDLLQLPTVEEAKAKEVEELGCYLSEGYSAIEIAAPRNVTKEVTSAVQKAIFARQVKSQLAMQNQRMGSRWEVLSLYEVSSFLTSVANLMANKERSPYLPENADAKELAPLLTTMFWLGKRLDRAVDLRLYKQIRNGDNEPGFVAIGNQGGYWVTEPAVPERKILPNDAQLTQVHEIATSFAISTGIGVEEIIARYVTDVHKYKSNFLFPRPDKQIYIKMVSDFLASVNRRHATRLTLNRISDYVFEMISRRDGADLTVAMFITGKEHFLGRNPSYYTSLSVENLRKIFKEVCTEIKDRHISETPRVDIRRTDSSVAKESLPKTSCNIGSPFRPTRNTVGNLINELKEKLEDANKVENGVLKLMRFHNSMTRYTAFMIAFGTGFRAIRDPFLSAAEVDWRSGFAVLADKDNEDGYNSRLIWLPPVCLEQLKLFREHQQNALYRFNILIPNLYSKLDRPRRDVPGRHMYFTNAVPNAGLEKDEYIAVNIRLKNLNRKLDYDLPFNASRHYLRSNLLERDCPVEVINALLGHFERGEEPWGSYSGLSPLVYRDVLMDKLIPLLKEDGWKAMPGLGANF
jgi:hypothetical protein